MPKLVIIGQSPAAYAAIRTLRASGAEWTVTLISTDTHLPYDRNRFPGLLGRKLKEKDVFCSTDTFYKEGKVETILDKELSRINFNRRKIYLSDRVQVDYDALLITDGPQVRLPEIKGIRRPGVFDMARLDSMRRLLKHLLFVETVVIVPVSFRGIEMALALKEAGKDIVLVSDQERVLSSFTSDAAVDALAGFIEKSGFRVMPSNGVEDILGEGEVQAVRLKSGKVMACQAVIFEGAQPDLRFLSDTDLLMRDRICVHTTMRTNIADVYAVDAVMELSAPSYIGSYSMESDLSMRQAECAVKAILGSDEPFELTLPDPVKSLESVFPIELLSKS
ncbi:MAG: NAD(P)/FAD-dependent oxidoreductase [Candidatus Omnitrophota bacterium]